MDNLEFLITGKTPVQYSTIMRIEILIGECTGDRDKFTQRMMGLTAEEDAQDLIRELLECQALPGRDRTPHTVKEQGEAIRYSVDKDDYYEQRGNIQR